jgi:hypothetical protein
MHKVEWTPAEHRLIRIILTAVPEVTVLATVAMLFWPHEFAESSTAVGTGLWIGAASGLAMVLVLYVLPLLLFGLGLRAGTYAKLTVIIIAAPVWALAGLQPLVVSLVGGWDGVSPLAVVVAAAIGALDWCVFVVALRGRRRLPKPPSHRAATTH